ncbi:class I SAM-dependent methyltransferase [uncultured Desulfuromusa sp.]|uniref:class I SAM-dependent methyltransferase n=1 Tax=uncultured Desulfuromusa sp. TaxID=219183 RepID=UPI002AA8CE9F|nr:class I SAM-dependent methyltransferase [uncultured Desulfuromusa sp.]
MDKTAITINSYDNSADKFAAKFMDFEPYKRKIHYFQKKYASYAKSIIDLGCGPGNASKIFFEQNPNCKITGIDLSREMIKLAKQKIPTGSFSVCDLRTIEQSSTYDAAIASFCIVHLSDEETTRFISKLSKLINLQGFLYLSFMEGSNAQYETTSFSEEEIYFNYFQRDAIVNQLEGVGFEINELLEQDYQENNGAMTKDVFIIAQRTT